MSKLTSKRANFSYSLPELAEISSMENGYAFCLNHKPGKIAGYNSMSSFSHHAKIMVTTNTTAREKLYLCTPV